MVKQLNNTTKQTPSSAFRVQWEKLQSSVFLLFPWWPTLVFQVLKCPAPTLLQRAIFFISFYSLSLHKQQLINQKPCHNIYTSINQLTVLNQSITASHLMYNILMNRQNLIVCIIEYCLDSIVQKIKLPEVFHPITY